MSKIEDTINQIGLEQGLKNIMAIGQQVALYYLVLIKNEVPQDVALTLTDAFQSWVLQYRPPEANNDHDV